MGSKVDEVIAYSTETPADTDNLVREAYEQGVDFTTFTSSSTVRNLVDLLDGNPDLINSSKTVIIGPITAETATELGVNIDVQAREQSIDGLVAAITSLASGS
jgi:uroporphyrinogen III methyltransferase/synthase